MNTSIVLENINIENSRLLARLSSAKFGHIIRAVRTYENLENPNG